jgi:hypothetical protein
MGIHRLRIAKALKPHGFLPFPASHPESSFHFWRRYSAGGFEGIVVGRAHEPGGREGDFVGALVDFSITPGEVGCLGMGDSRCLVNELLADGAGHRDVRKREDALDWETRLIATAPAACAAFAQEHAPRILAATAAARAASEHYLGLAGFPESSLDESRRMLRAACTSAQLREADRVWKYAYAFEGGEVPYEVAALAVVLHCGAVDNDPELTLGRPENEGKPDLPEYPGRKTDVVLLTRLHYMASKLARQPGWPESESPK